MAVHHSLHSSALAQNHSLHFSNFDSQNSSGKFTNCTQCEYPDDATLGSLATSLLIGYLINWGLLGLLISQVYTYYMGFPNDRRRIKFLVYGLLLIEIAQTVMITRDAIVVYPQGLMNSKHTMDAMRKDIENKTSQDQGFFNGSNVALHPAIFQRTQHSSSHKLPAYPKNASTLIQLASVSSFDSHPTINNVHLLWLTVPVIAGIVGFIGQTFFAYRLYRLSNSAVLCGLIVSLGILSTAFAIVCGGRMLFLRKLMTGIHDPIFLVTCGLWNGFAALCDVIIAVCMTYYLSHHRDPIFGETQVLLNKLKRLTIETGAVTATTAILNIVLYVGFRSIPKVSAYFAIPAAAIAKLYSITILSTLNSRLLFVGGRYSMKTEISSTDTAVMDDGRNRLIFSKREMKFQPQSVAEVRIEQHKVTWRESDRRVSSGKRATLVPGDRRQGRYNSDDTIVGRV